jgi:curved DNA-binding protein CbpA
MWPEDYYEFLGVRRNAGPDEILTAYREHVRYFPAGINLPPEQIESWLRALRTAYETLADPKQRAEYDSCHPPVRADGGNGQGEEDLRGRLARLESELARARQQRDEYHRLAYEALAKLNPVDLSEDWVHQPEGTPIETILAEHEASRGG